MSLIVAIKRDGYIYLGADTLTSNRVYKKTNLENEYLKIQNIANGILLGTIGLLAQNQQMKVSETFKKIKSGDLTKEYIVNEVVNPLYQEFRQNGILKSFGYVFTIELLFAKRDKLFHMDRNGLVTEIEDFILIGAGSGYGREILSNIKGDNWYKEIRECLNLASKYTDTVEKPYIYSNTKTSDIIIGTGEKYL